MHRLSGSYSMETPEMSGCPVTGHSDVTSSVVNRTLVNVSGAGNESTCSTGPRTSDPSTVSEDRSGSVITAAYGAGGPGDSFNPDGRFLAVAPDNCPVGDL